MINSNINSIIPTSSIYANNIAIVGQGIFNSGESNQLGSVIKL